MAIVQKQAFNIYTTMLVISLSALVIASVLLWLELSSYGSFPAWNVPRMR